MYRVERHVCARLPDGHRHSGADVNDTLGPSRGEHHAPSRPLSTPSPFDRRLVRAVSHRTSPPCTQGYLEHPQQEHSAELRGLDAHVRKLLTARMRTLHPPGVSPLVLPCALPHAAQGRSDHGTDPEGCEGIPVAESGSGCSRTSEEDCEEWC